MDYNITGRADFKNGASVVTKHLHHPGTVSKFQLNIDANQIMATSKLIVSCIAGYSNFKAIPPEPLPTITIPGLIQEKACGVNTVLKYNPYQCPTIYDVEIESPSFFEITIILQGTLFTCNKGRGMLGYSEAIGFAMQNQSNQGVIMLDEAAFDPLNDFIVAAGGPDFRAMPFSLASLKMLPEALQYAVVNKIFNEPKQLMHGPLKALPKKDLLADFLGDAVAAEVDFDHRELKKLAQHMIDQGWSNAT